MFLFVNINYINLDEKGFFSKLILIKFNYVGIIFYKIMFILIFLKIMYVFICKVNFI